MVNYPPKHTQSTKNARFYPVIVLLFLGLFYSSNLHSQCKSFARAVAKPELAPFIHDGNFNSTILGEGESVVLQKTVFQDQKYRIVVKGVSELPGLRFRVIDSGSRVLFDNALYDYASTWDFDVQDTRTISVEVTVLEDESPGSTLGGCVVILFGLNME